MGILTTCKWHSSQYLFGEAIRLRRLNQRKDDYLSSLNRLKHDYLSSLNRLKEKTIRSKFPFNMTNDMIALASNWEDRLRPPKCDKKEDQQVWATSFPHLLTLTQCFPTFFRSRPTFNASFIVRPTIRMTKINSYLRPASLLLFTWNQQTNNLPIVIVAYLHFPTSRGVRTEIVDATQHI